MRNLEFSAKDFAWYGEGILGPPHTVRKELSKLPHEAVFSAVSPRVRGDFGEKFALRGSGNKIKHV